MSVEQGYKNIEDAESAEDAIDKLSGSEDWKKGEEHSGPVHRFIEGEWFTEDGGKLINKTEIKRESNSSDYEEHMRIINELNDKKFSVIINDSSKVFAGDEKSKGNYKENIHATVYILRGNEIEIHTFHGNEKELKELLQYSDDLMNDDYDDEDLDLSKIQKPKTTFNLNSVFSSSERLSVQANTEASAWDSFWKDLLKPTSDQQEGQEQSKGLLEIFDFKADSANQTDQVNTIEPNKQTKALNLFATSSPALVEPKSAEPFITILDKQPALIVDEVPAMTSSETLSLPIKTEIPQINLIQPEAAAIYIDEDTELEDGSVMSQLEAQPPITIPEANSDNGLVQQSELLDLEGAQTENQEQVITIVGQPAQKTEIRAPQIDSYIPASEPEISTKALMDVISGSIDAPIAKEATSEDGNTGIVEEDQPIKLIISETLTAEKGESNDNSSVYETKAQAQERPEQNQSILELETQQDTMAVESADDDEVITVTQKSEAAEMANTITITEISTPALESSPAATPEFSLLRSSTGENILLARQSFSEGRGPELSFATINREKESANTKDTGVELKVTDDQTTYLIEQVRALRQVIKTETIRSQTIIKAKAADKSPTLIRPVAIQKQEFRQQEAKALEEEQTSAILTALEKFQTPREPVRIVAENLTQAVQRQQESTQRIRNILESPRNSIRSAKARVINSPEKSGQTKLKQLLPVAQQYMDDLESVVVNSSGIRLAA